MKVKIGIIGCGKIAQVRHIPEYKENKNAEIVGFYGRNEDRTQKMVEKYGGKSYTSYEELLANPGIDAVSICTANHVHAEMAIAALKAGKHVLCEKPMATRLEDCEKMVEVAKRTGKLLMIGHNQRYAKAHDKAKKLIQEGVIGEIITFKTTFGHGGPETWSIDPGKNVWFFRKSEAGLGAIGDLGIHKTDLIQFLTGQVVVETTAKLVTLHKKDAQGHPIGVEDNAFCIYRMSGGIVGTMTASWNYYGPEDNSTILYGTKGIMHIYDDAQYSIKIMLKNGENIYYDIDQIQTNDNQSKSGVIDHFVECLVENKEPEISGTEALKAMRAVFASMESSKTGRTVVVQQY
ncbi:Gfo/Idh/MocA family oxidoreductase [Irregularibacter muris]|uniref:Gfo/Idh/MocA family oxidoreductase n=1 Tax=Irregularibacter muris TaxID=1796619 RepID=A0AAE3KZJ0_9FIRM|nr:Gfo/Idh/MocA family oxidoreductase [Irregularibacter muris]MCR1898367.1 Gfo/Idh/MocA family oxidoreductase [Irregularibacter muris]